MTVLTDRDGSATETERRFIVAACCFLLVSMLSPSSALCAVAEQRMEIQDMSDKGSPIQVSGYMMLRHDSSNPFPFSYEESTSVKNVSAKSILLMVVHLEATSGPGSDERYSQEYFFADALAPGQVEVNHEPERKFGVAVVNGEPLSYKRDPHPAAQAHAEFVQFSDGSTWGDADSAEHLLEARRQTLAELNRLEHLYEQAGESAFLDEFARADDFDNIFRQLKSGCSDKAAKPNCAYNSVHRTFVIAKQHEAEINSSAGVETKQ
jgi:hypothetical protein